MKLVSATSSRKHLADAVVSPVDECGNLHVVDVLVSFETIDNLR